MISRRRPILHMVPENQVCFRNVCSLYQGLYHIGLYPVITINMHYPISFRD